jgi:ferritin
MDKKLHQRLNEHLALEFGAAHKYLAMSIWCEANDLLGFAGWLRQQSAEETDHANRIINHLMERDLHVQLPALEQPPSEWSSALEAVEAVLESEKTVTAAINELYDLAEKSGDRATSIMLQWFVNEQVEEENLVRGILGRLRLAGSDGLGLLMVDQEVASGKLTPEHDAE